MRSRAWAVTAASLPGNVTGEYIMAKFEIIIGNIDTVHEGNNYMKACTVYTQYVKASKAGIGRASRKSVIMLHRRIPHEIRVLRRYWP